MDIRKLLGLLLLMSGAFLSYSQSTSSVSGLVRDNLSRKAVEGAFVYFVGDDSLTAVTDQSGRFSLLNIKPGRYVCTVHSLGYETDQQEVLVISGKVAMVDFNLYEKVVQLETLTIQARPSNNEGGTISLPIEKVMRMPANFFDPVRMLSSYPGVVTFNDQANNIVVKGNSPTGLLWRLNGMDIVNPNHLANAGTFNDKPTANGGGVNILSAQMLDRTDFYSGNMPARYGNLTAAGLDMTLRNGSSQRPEYTAQASLIGLDFAAEGPTSESGRTTYLANARYSTVGLLSEMGVNFGDEKISFKDFSFNINSMIGQKGGSISFFGFGGLSSNTFDAKDSSEWEVDKDRFTILYHNETYAIGTRLDLPLKRSFTFSSGATLSGNDQTRTSNSIETPELPRQQSSLATNRKLLSAFASISGKWSPKLGAEFGVMVNYNRDWINNFELLPAMSSNPTTVNATHSYTLVQPYAQLSFRSGKFSATAGGRFMYNTDDNTSFDPRINLQYQLTTNSNIYVTGGQLSQMFPVGVYVEQPIGSLDFLRKRFVEAGAITQLTNWKLNASVYMHEYANVPVSFSDNFSALNYIEGVVTQPLTSTGTGTNYGIAYQAERSFVDGYYLLAGASVYRSLYTASDGIERPTKFDGRYSLMVTGGREWNKQVDEYNRSFGIHGRMMYLGGLRDTPIDEDMSRTMGITTYFSDAYSIMLKDYVRFDLRVSWRRDKKNYTRTIALDVQNLAGIKNQAYKYYDAFQGKVVTQYQVGFIPVLVYRIDF